MGAMSLRSATRARALVRAARVARQRAAARARARPRARPQPRVALGEPRGVVARLALEQVRRERGERQHAGAADVARRAGAALVRVDADLLLAVKPARRARRTAA